MKQLNKTQILGLALVGLSLFTIMDGIQLVGGAFNLSVTTNRWKTAEVHGLYVPQYLEPGEMLVTVVFTAYNGHETSGSLLYDMLITGHAAGGTSGLQFSPNVSALSEQNITVTLYRVPIVMGSTPITVTVRDGMTGQSEVTATIQSGIAPEPEPTPEPEPDVDVSEDIENRLQTYSLFTGALGAGVFTLGCVKEEKR